MYETLEERRKRLLGQQPGNSSGGSLPSQSGQGGGTLQQRRLDYLKKFEEDQKQEKKPKVELQQPQQQEQKPQEKGVLDKVGDFLSGKFGQQPDIKSPVPEKDTLFVKKKAEDSWLKFPSIFDHPNRVSGTSTDDLAKNVQKKIDANPGKTYNDATKDFVQYNPDRNKAVDGATKVMGSFFDEFIKTNEMNAEIGRGEAKSLNNAFLSFVPSLHNAVDQFLSRTPQRAQDGTSLTDEERQGAQKIGEVYSLALQAYAFAGTEALTAEKLAAAGFTKFVRPLAGSLTFLGLGQLSTSVDVPKRVEKALVDASTGFIQHFVGGTGLVKGTVGTAGLFGAQGYVDALIEGSSKEEALAAAKASAFMGGLFHIFGSAMGALHGEVDTLGNKETVNRSLKPQIDTPEKFRSEEEKLSFQQLKDDPQGFVDKYQEKFGNVVNADNAMSLFNGYDNTNSTDYSKAGGNIAKMVLDSQLEAHKNDENKIVLFTSGGTGSGKSTASTGVSGDYSVVFDSTLSNFDRADANIKKAIDKGYQVDIRYVYRDPVRSWTDGVLRRFQEGDPRAIPINAHIDTHVNSQEAIIKLWDKYKDSDKVKIRFFNNSTGSEEAQATGIDFIKKLQYNKDDLRKQLYDYTRLFYEHSQDLTGSQFDALVGRARSQVLESAQGRDTNQQETKKGQLETSTDPEQVIGKTFKSTLSDREFTPVKIIGNEAVDAGGERVLTEGLHSDIWKEQPQPDILRDFPELSPKDNFVYMHAGFDPGIDKFISEDIPEGVQLAKDKANAVKNIVSYVKDTIVNVVQPAYPVEKNFGKDVYASVIRAISTPDAMELAFEGQRSQTFDKNFGQLEKWFNKFKEEDLKNFNLTRGEAESKGGQALQQAARENLNETLKSPDLLKSITETSDFVFEWGRKNGVDLNYFEDYFYGAYKPGKDGQTVDNFVDYWRSTDRYTKEKKLPTIADALDYGLELRDQNPISNIKSEMKAMAKRVGLVHLKEDMLSHENNYAVKKETANETQAKSWRKIEDPVFKDVLVDPKYATFVNNLLSANKIYQNPLLKGLREVTFLSQQIKFFGSLFHMQNMLKGAISEDLAGIVNPKGWIDFGKSFKTVEKDNPVYLDYVGLGGGHRYSVEAQAKDQISAFFDKASRGNTIGALIRAPLAVAEVKYIPASPGFINWMFEDFIPTLKFNKYSEEVFSKSNRLGRPLSDAEKIDIIKQNQNFFGEMNERLFGRSGTTTTALRLLFTAPGYGEGNFRTLFRASTGDKKSANFVLNSLLTSLVVGTVGTLFATGKFPDAPKTLEDIRDLFKIKTNLKDGNGDQVYFDAMTYDKDYWSIYGNLFTGQLSKIPTELTSRVAGMFAAPARIMTDMATLLEGSMVYDFKGEPLFYKTDDFTTKLSKFIQKEGVASQPISTSNFGTAFKTNANIPLSVATSVAGVRQTTTEGVKDIKAARQDLFALQQSKKNKQIELDKIANENPPEAIRMAKEFNKEQMQKVVGLAKQLGYKNVSTSTLKRDYLIEKLKKGKPKRGTNVDSFFGITQP